MFKNYALDDKCLESWRMKDLLEMKFYVRKNICGLSTQCQYELMQFEDKRLTQMRIDDQNGTR